MRLTQQHFLQIQTALLDGYDRPGLRRMLRLGLDVALDDITSGTTDTQIVFDVVEWAERTDNVPALVAAAAEHNPQNTLLQQLQAAAATWSAPGATGPAARAAPPPASAAPSAGGDIIIATIGAGAKDIAVGKDIQQSGGGANAHKEH